MLRGAIKIVDLFYESLSRLTVFTVIDSINNSETVMY